MISVEEAFQKWYQSQPPTFVDRSGHAHEGFCAGFVAALTEAANHIDRGPQIPLPPSIYSALCHEWAEDCMVAQGGDDHAAE